MALLSFNNVFKVYREGDHPVYAVRGVNFTISSGEFVAVMGASGSGKSTILNILGLLDRPTTGTYKLEDIDVSSLDDDEMSEIRCRRIGIVFQSFNLFAQFSVVENVCTPMRYAHVPPAIMRARAEELLGKLGMSHRLSHRPTQLSGGERQRVAIARALSNDPPLILADEPTGNLDEKTGEEVIRILTTLVEGGRTVVMVTHNPAYEEIVDRVIRLHDGEIVEDRPGGRGGRRA
ncbi:MAG: ABC transporter ATP-binding protein [Lentisphaerae bacterium]|jgi:putative ABC transport system ATP-binding protein|nr:ABC transporter ATP-binding protein [Lentisphaerota bacterium]